MQKVVMQKIVVVMEKAPRNFGAYSKNVEGIFGVGDTIEQTKQSIAGAIELMKESCIEDGFPIPEVLCGKYAVRYEYGWQCDERLLHYRDELFKNLVQITEGHPCGLPREEELNVFWNIAYNSTDEYIDALKEYNSPEEASNLITL